ncbi:MAG TPA: cation diffusion facilitator family transporter [Kiritimatiellia bacterium]|nr:cation diffusion facilitator family transporter [Kiritimatiellia bacterium]HNS81099.1 cation diffusion facilitator family transporter [Kiritimatiellia bacterium]HPA77575.1 cation diffusion facilitator family transporter [Kiritimatiellia bacterium]HQQ03613.1 cation diffusion facilitator family transporter [Kiritimatiellia bacterium]
MMNNEHQEQIRGFTGWLARRVLKSGADLRTGDSRSRLGMLQGAVGIIANLFIFLVKITFGFVFGSIALIADSFDSLSDVAASTMIIVGAHWAGKPRDREHPFGHGRMEWIASLIVSILLVGVGLSLGKEAVVRIFRPHPYDAPWWLIAIVAASIPLKEWMAHFSRSLSRASGSSLIEAGYWHFRFDSLMAGLVCVALFSSRFGWAAVDGWMGLIIAGLIMHGGLSLIRERVSLLLGEAPSAEEISQLEKLAFQVDGVRDAHDIIVHKYGDYRLISLDIEVDACGTALEAHRIAAQVEQKIEDNCHAKAIVHVDPVDRSHRLYPEAESVLSRYISAHGEIASFHDLRLTDEEGGPVLTADIVMATKTPETAHAQIIEDLKNHLSLHLHTVSRLHIDTEIFHGQPAASPAVGKINA